MAATIAKAWADDRKYASRLGERVATVEAATWRTFVKATVLRDGSVSVTVTRNGKLEHTYTLEAEG